MLAEKQFLHYKYYLLCVVRRKPLPPEKIINFVNQSHGFGFEDSTIRSDKVSPNIALIKIYFFSIEKMDEDKSNENALTIGTPVSVIGNKLNPDQYQENIMTGLADNTVRDTIPPTDTIDITSNSNNNGNSSGDDNSNSHVKCRDLKQITGIDATSAATSNDKQRNSEGNLNVNNILTEADNADIEAQTIVLAPGTFTGTTNVDANNIMNSNNMDTSNIQNAMTGPAAAAAATTGAASNTAIGNSNSTANQNIPMPEMLLETKNSSNAFNDNPVNMSNANNNIPTMNNMNLNQYILTSAGVPPISLPANIAVSTPATAYNNFNANAINPITPATIDANNLTNVTISNKQHYQSAILQQNAAIMQQNAATLQHLKNLQRTNKMMAANPGTAATLGMLAPIMNMNLPTTANPVQLLAGVAPPLNLNNNTVGAASALPTAATALQATTANLSEIDGRSTITTAPIVGAQHQESYQNQQQQGVPISAQQPGTMAIAPGGSPPFPVVGVTNNNINTNNSTISNINNGIVGGSNNNNNDAVQNILRTAFMLQNGGLSLLQQGAIPQQQQQQQQQQLIPTQVGSGIVMMINNNNSNLPFGIIPAGTSANINNGTSSGGNSESKKVGNSTSDVGNNGGLPTSAVAAAANAAASVLPPASMNLPLQQQMQQQPLNTALPPQMGIDLSNSTNIINNSNISAIPLLAGAVMNNSTINNGSNMNNNSVQLAGLATLQLQQQQQQRIHAMAYPPMNLAQSLPQRPLTMPLISTQQTQQLQHQQQSQSQSLGSTLNPTATSKLKQSQTQTKKKSISRPLYLDHDSNCKFSFSICFLYYHKVFASTRTTTCTVTFM